MRTIYKYPLFRERRQLVRMPAGARVLAAQMKDDAITLWALVDPDERPAARAVYIFGTGHQLPGVGSLDYVGTVQDGPLVWHVFLGEPA